MLRLIKINDENYLVYDDDYGITHKQKIEDDFLFIIRILLEDHKGGLND